MTITYAQRISNRLATLRSDNSARGACEAIAAEADAEIERLRSDAERLRAALRRILRSIPTDSDMSDAGWESCEINEACDAYDQARAALKETP